MIEYNKLTPREKEVFKLEAKGRSRKIIADTLNISVKTVDKHRSNFMDKLMLSERAEIEQLVQLLGLVES